MGVGPPRTYLPEQTLFTVYHRCKTVTSVSSASFPLKALSSPASPLLPLVSPCWPFSRPAQDGQGPRSRGRGFRFRPAEGRGRERAQSRRGKETLFPFLLFSRWFLIPEDAAGPRAALGRLLEASLGGSPSWADRVQVCMAVLATAPELSPHPLCPHPAFR